MQDIPHRLYRGKHSIGFSLQIKPSWTVPVSLMETKTVIKARNPWVVYVTTRQSPSTHGCCQCRNICKRFVISQCLQAVSIPNSTRKKNIVFLPWAELFLISQNRFLKKPLSPLGAHLLPSWIISVVMWQFFSPFLFSWPFLLSFHSVCYLSSPFPFISVFFLFFKLAIRCHQTDIGNWLALPTSGTRAKPRENRSQTL